MKALAMNKSRRVCVRVFLVLILGLAFSVSVDAATFVVSNTNDFGAGSLRQAITAANANPGADLITFSIGSGAKTIAPNTALPKITDPVTIDGTTQPGYSGSPIIELNGSFVQPPQWWESAAGLYIVAGDSVVQGLVINRFPSGQIVLEVKGGNTIRGNYLGPDINGTQGFWIGNGVNVFSSQNLIGGSTPDARNVISGNGVGINVYGKNVTDNRIQGNYVGTTADGIAALANRYGALSIGDSPGNLIGGTQPGTRNIIAGNDGGGVGITSAATGNTIQGNYIGLNVNGELLKNSGDGVSISSSNNIIGGLTPEARNIISSSGSDGIHIYRSGFDASPTGNQVLGNYIGTDATGTKAFGNFDSGIVLNNTAGNTIGGATPGAGNLISGNRGIGVHVAGNNEQILGNLIGTQSDGVSPLGNGLYGVVISAEKKGVVIGRTDSGAGNVIAHNGLSGVSVGGSNFSSLPEQGKAIRGNSIFSNKNLGIDLDVSYTVPQPNDLGDTDVGANMLQNYPVLTSAEASSSVVQVKGTLNSLANSNFALDFYANDISDPSGYGEGQKYIGSAAVVTDGAGNVSFSVNLPVAVKVGSFITATATDSQNNTSEFAQCVQAVSAPPPPPPPAPILLTEEISQHAVSLDSVTMLRDSFQILAENNFSADQHTRVMLFAMNVDLQPGETSSIITAQAVDSLDRVYPLTIEYVGKVPNMGWLTQLNIRLPDELKAVGDVRVFISLRGLNSNKALISIKSP
jgi:hypothetical protein